MYYDEVLDLWFGGVLFVISCTTYHYKNMWVYCYHSFINLNFSANLESYDLHLILSVLL